MSAAKQFRIESEHIMSAPAITEFEEKQEKLAEFLCQMARGMSLSEMVEAGEPEVADNYRGDAEDVLRLQPWLLSLEERERLDV